jgi:hypothetical protein
MQFEGGVFEDTAGGSLGRVEQRKRDVAVFGRIEDGSSMMRRLAILPGTGSGCVSSSEESKSYQSRFLVKDGEKESAASPGPHASADSPEITNGSTPHSKVFICSPSPPSCSAISQILSSEVPNRL